MDLLNYSVVDNTTGAIKTAKGLAVLLISDAAFSVLKTEMDIDEAFGGRQDKRVDLASTSKKTVMVTLSENPLFAGQQHEVKPIIDNLNKLIGEATTAIESDDTRRKQFGYNIDIYDFYKHIIEKLVDSIELIQDDYKPSTSPTTAMRHLGAVRILFDGDEWLLKSDNIKLGEYICETIINGTSLGVMRQSDKVSSDAQRIGALFNFISAQMICEVIANHQTNAAVNNPDTVKKAKAIADLVGGNHEDYLYAVINFDTKLREVVATSNMSTDEAITYMLKKDIGMNDSQITDIAKIFKQKPLYH